MKKIYYLIPLLVCLSCFSSCNNDNETDEALPPVVQQKQWTDYLSHYGVENTLLVNGAVMVDNYRTVLLEEDENNRARITLCNLVIDVDTLIFENVLMTETETGFSFDGMETVEDARIALSGQLLISESGTSSVNVSIAREDISGVAANWQLVYNEDRSSVNFQLRAEGGIAGVLSNLLEYFDIGGMIAEKLAALNLYFSPQGTMDFGFTTIESGQEVNIAGLLTGLSDDPFLSSILTNVACDLKVEYLTHSQKTLFVGLNRKDIDPLLSILSSDDLNFGFDMDLGIDIDLDILKSLLVMYPNYYFLPLSFSLEENDLWVYVEKDFILTLWPMIQPILENIDLSSYNYFVQLAIRAAIASIPNLLPTADLLEVRLGFTLME